MDAIGQVQNLQESIKKMQEQLRQLQMDGDTGEYVPLGNTACKEIIQSRWPVKVPQTTRFKMEENMQNRLLKGIRENNYLTNKCTWNEIATLDTTLYHRAHLEYYEAKQEGMGHDGVWHMAIVLCDGNFKGRCGYASFTNKRDTESMCIRELLHNMYIHESEQQADVESPSTVTAHSTGVTAALEVEEISDACEVISPPFETTTSEEKYVPQQVSDRWIKLDHVAWNSAGLNGQQTLTWDLPKALTRTQTQLCDSLIMAQWRLHRTQKMRMVVEFLAPSQKLITGQCFAKWYAMGFADKDIKHRLNKYSMSQGRHLDIRPGSKTTARLVIPFNCNNASLVNQQTQFEIVSALNLGMLALTIVAPLGTSPYETPEVGISVMITFESELAAKIDGGILQMPRLRQEGLISDVVNSDAAAPVVSTFEDIEKLFHAMKKTKDEDKPMNPFQRVAVIPRFMESMSHGTNIDEQCMSMRLDAKGKKPSILTRQGNEIAGMIRCKSLFRQITWNTTQQAGTLLTRFSVAAVCDPDEYADVVIEENGDSILAKAVPACDVVASCHTYTSGSLEFTFQSVVGEFHTGALTVVMVPLTDPSLPDLTAEQLNNVRREVFEIGRQTADFVMTSDYNNTNQVIGTNSSARGSTTPRRMMAQCFVYIESPLKTNAAQEITINIYKRGAPDFEVIEMKNAIMSPSFSAPILLDPSALLPSSVEATDFYPGVDGAIWEGDNLVLRYSSIGDSVAQWDVPGRNFTVAQISGFDPAVVVPNQGSGFVGAFNGWIQFNGIVTKLSPSVRTYGYKRVILWRFPGFRGDLMVAFPIPEVYRTVGSPNWTPISLAHPDFFANLDRVLTRWQQEYPTSTASDDIRDYLIFTSDDADYFSTLFSPSTKSGLVDLGPTYFSNMSLGTLPPALDQETESGIHVASGATNLKRATDWGKTIYGEEGGSLKAILRRPIYIASFSYSPASNVQWPYARATMQLSHWMQPANFNDPIHFANRWSTQALLLTGFTFVSGSINRRIKGAAIPNVTMWVNHKFFDKPARTFAVTEYDKTRGTPVYAQSLPTEIADLNVNSHLNLNFAWKNENVRNFLFNRADTTDSNIQQCYDIGTADIGFENTVQNNTTDEHTYSFSIYQSFGDDTEVSLFRGFPPMVFNEDLEEEHPVGLPALEQETSVEEESSWFGNMGASFLNKAIGVDKIVEDVKVTVVQGLAKAKEDGIHELHTQVNKQFADLQQEISQQLTELGFSRLRDVVLGEVIHFISNPNKASIIASVVNIIVQLGLFTFETCASLKTVLEALFTGDETQPDSSSASGEKEQQSDGVFEDNITSFASLILTSICSYIGWTKATPYLSGLDWKSKLAFAIPSFFSMGFSFKRFLQQLFPFLKWAFDYVLNLKAQYIDDPISGFVNINRGLIGGWVNEVNTVCARKYDTSTIENRDRVYLAYNIGKMLEQRVLAHTSRFNVLKSYVKQINEKWDTVESEGLTAGVRKEPFSMWVYGPPGVGKSTVINDVVAKIIKDNNIEVPKGEMTLAVSPTSKYLTRIKGQPEMRIDDFFAVNAPEISASQIAYVFDVVTSAPYVPNQAAVEDKDKLYHPSIFTVLSNFPEPANAPINNHAAFLRRRDVTIKVIPNEVRLREKWGAEFDAALTAAKGIYGNLPQHMKENYDHLRFMFVHVEHNKEPVPISFSNQITHSYDEFQSLMGQIYIKRDQEKTASYKQRLTAHYSSRGLQVPDFSTLLEAGDMDLKKAIQAWIQVNEGDRTVRDGVHKLFDAKHTDTAEANRVLAQCVQFPRLADLLRRYDSDAETLVPGTSSDTHPRCIIGDDMIFEKPASMRLKFLEAYDPVVGNDVARVLDSNEIVYTREILVQKGDALIPACYSVLEHAKCGHCIKGKSSKEVAEILITPSCARHCYLPDEFRIECANHYFLYEKRDDAALCRIRPVMNALIQKSKNWYSTAVEALKSMVGYLYDKVKVMGISLRNFFQEHWKVTLAIFGVICSVAYAIFKTSEEDSYLFKIMPDGNVKTKLGMTVNAARNKVSKVKNFLGFTNGLEQEAYNTKHRATVIDVRPAGNRTSAPKAQETDIQEDTLRIVTEAFIPVICEMGPEWPKPIWHTTFFSYGGRQAVMTRHEWEIMQFANKVNIVMNTNKGVRYTIPLEVSELKWKELEHYSTYKDCRKGNLGILTLPKNVPPKRSLITKKHSWFQTGSTVNAFTGALVCPVRVTDEGSFNPIFLLEYEHTSTPERTKPITIEGRSMSTATIYSDNYQYPVSKRGYCLGALVDSGSGKIVGFHYAGDGAVGTSERVLSEYFEVDKYTYESMKLQEPNISFDEIDGVVLPLGHTSEKHQQSEESKIVPSPIAGCVPITTGLAQLSKTTWSPLYMGVAKHGRPPINFPRHHVKEAAADLLRVIKRARPILRDTTGAMRFMTTDEAIFGIKGIVNSMDMTTSCGYGWKNCGPGKRGLINIDTETISPELRLRVNAMEKKFQKNIIPFILATDCLKDETLPLTKIAKEGHTRIISTLPVDYQILLRKYTMPFIIAYHAYNLECEHAIGISVAGPHEMQFDRLGKKMEGNIVAGDFSNFGPGANAIVADECLQIISAWYRHYGAPPEFCATLEALLQPLICTPHLAYDKVYQTCSGIISGSAITVELNSLIHCIYMRVGALGMGISLCDFNSEVIMITYGDDGLMKVSDYLIDKFNVATLRDFFAKYNIRYTSVDKSDNIVAYTDLAATSFLKHSFKFSDGQYLAALTKDSIENQINWISKVGNKKENTIVNCLTALRQAYPHGEDYYNDLRSKLQDAMISARIYAYLPNYREARVIRYNSVSNESALSSNLEKMKTKQELDRILCQATGINQDGVLSSVLLGGQTGCGEIPVRGVPLISL